MLPAILRSLTGGEEKPRTQETLLDSLDINYVGPNLLACGRPWRHASNRHARRVNVKDLAVFLNSEFGQNYLIINLASSKCIYDYSLFNHQVLDFEISSSCPSLRSLLEFCSTVAAFLKLSVENSVIVHCESAKIKSSLCVAAFYLFQGICDAPTQALELFAERRGLSEAVLLVEARIRLLLQFSMALRAPLPNTSVVKMKHAILSFQAPSLSSSVDSIKGTSPPEGEILGPVPDQYAIELQCNDKVVYSSLNADEDVYGDDFAVKIPLNVAVFGSCVLTCKLLQDDPLNDSVGSTSSDPDDLHDRVLFRSWFHTAFLPNSVMQITNSKMEFSRFARESLRPVKSLDIFYTMRISPPSASIVPAAFVQNAVTDNSSRDGAVGTWHQSSLLATKVEDAVAWWQGKLSAVQRRKRLRGGLAFLDAQDALANDKLCTPLHLWEGLATLCMAHALKTPPKLWSSLALNGFHPILAHYCCQRENLDVHSAHLLCKQIATFDILGLKLGLAGHDESDCVPTVMNISQLLSTPERGYDITSEEGEALEPSPILKKGDDPDVSGCSNSQQQLATSIHHHIHQHSHHHYHQHNHGHCDHHGHCPAPGTNISSDEHRYLSPQPSAKRRLKLQVPLDFDKNRGSSDSRLSSLQTQAELSETTLDDANAQGQIYGSASRPSTSATSCDSMLLFEGQHPDVLAKAQGTALVPLEQLKEYMNNAKSPLTEYFVDLERKEATRKHKISEGKKRLQQIQRRVKRRQQVKTGISRVTKQVKYTTTCVNEGDALSQDQDTAVKAPPFVPAPPISAADLSERTGEVAPGDGGESKNGNLFRSVASDGSVPWDMKDLPVAGPRMPEAMPPSPSLLPRDDFESHQESVPTPSKPSRTPPPSVSLTTPSSQPSPAVIPRTQSAIPAPPPPPPPPPPPALSSSAGNFSTTAIAEAAQLHKPSFVPPPPPPPPPPPQTPAGNHGIPPPPPPPPLPLPGRMSANIGTLPPTPEKIVEKKIHWQTVPQHKLRNTIWANEESNDAVSVDVQEFEKLFCKSAQQVKRAQQEARKRRLKKAQAPQASGFLDSNRSRNVGIILTRFKKVVTSFAELIDTVIQLDETVWSVDELMLLKKALPTDEELDAVQLFQGDRTTLSEAEKFFVTVQEECPAFGLIVDSFILKLDFSARSEGVSRDLRKVLQACVELKNSKTLQRALKLALDLGNLANTRYAPTTMRSHSAHGISVASLGKLKEFKAPGKKGVTMLSFLAQTLQQEDETFSVEFADGFSAVASARHVDVQFLEGEVSELEKCAVQMEKDLPFLQDITPELGDVSAAILDELGVLKAVLAETQEASRAIVSYFGEDDGFGAQALFTHLHNFILSLSQAADCSAAL